LDFAKLYKARYNVFVVMEKVKGSIKQKTQIKMDGNTKSSFGIPGFDALLKGNHVQSPISILVTGGSGVGKTIFVLQFIYNGAKMGIPGLYIAYEETMTSLKILAKSLGFDDFEELEKKGLITIIEQPAAKGKITSIRNPLQLIKVKKAKRVVLDSLTLFEFIYSKDPISFRKGLIEFLDYMRQAGVMLIATSERKSGNITDFTHEIQDFLFDGLVVLCRIRKGSIFERCITIMKLRGHDHTLNICPLSIQKGGMIIYPEQIPFSLIEKE